MTARNRVHEKGFTLLEVLFALVSSVILVGGVLAIFTLASRLHAAGSSQMRIQSQARYGIELIADNISAAELLSVPTGGDQIQLTIPISNLTASISSSAVTVPVLSARLFPHVGAVQVENEIISYASKSDAALLSCTRGYGGSTAAAHQNDLIVYIRPLYYLNNTRIYLNLNGNPSTATDQVVISYVEKIPGVNLFRHYPVGATSYKADRILVSFRCFDDIDNDNNRDRGEPGLNFELELFARNV